MSSEKGFKNALSIETSTFHFFEKDNLLTCYNQQAIYIAKRFYKTLSIVKKEDNLDCITIMRKFFGKIALDLLENNISIQLWAKSDNSTASWRASKFATPGNFKDLDYLQELREVDTASAAVNICTDEVLGIHVGVCVVSTSTNSIFLMQFVDSEDLCG